MNPTISVEDCIVRLDTIMVGISSRTIIPSQELMDELLELRNLLSGVEREDIYCGAPIRSMYHD